MSQRIYNSQALALADLNGDGKLDLVLNNEGQDSAVLFGNKELAGKCTQVVLRMGPESVGSRVRVVDKDGKTVAMQEVSGGEGRGGQARWRRGSRLCRDNTASRSGPRRAKVKRKRWRSRKRPCACGSMARMNRRRR